MKTRILLMKNKLDSLKTHGDQLLIVHDDVLDDVGEVYMRRRQIKIVTIIVETTNIYIAKKSRKHVKY